MKPARSRRPKAFGKRAYMDFSTWKRSEPPALGNSSRRAKATAPCAARWWCRLRSRIRQRTSSAAILLALAPALMAQQYDVVLAGGRVMDPASNLDAVRYVG